MLALPHPNLPFVTETDTSDFQVGVALFQVYPDGNMNQMDFGPGR